MFPDVAVTVTVEVPGVTGVGDPDGFADPPHPVMASKVINKETEPVKIAIDFAALRRLLQIGKRPAMPSGKMALAVRADTLFAFAE